MDRYLSDSGMRMAALALGILAALYGLAFVFFGDRALELAGVRSTPLLWYFLYVLPFMALIGGGLALSAPGMAGLLLLVSTGGWLFMGVVLGFGFALTIAPLIVSAAGTVLVLASAGPREFMFATDRLSTWTGKLFAMSIIILTVVVCYEVFMRYVMRAPTRWAYDAGYMLYGAGFFMAGAYALAQNAHVRADVIYRFWRPRVQASIDLVLFLIFYFPAAFFFIYSGWFFAERSWVMREFSSASPFNIPVYHFKTLIPIAGVFLFLQGLAELTRCGLCLRDGRWPPRLADVEEIEKQALEGHVPISVAGTVPIDQAHELGLEVGDEPPREGERR
jgi:TRAP-type mannitol/chloroaromatic compound transport system permease small subunit